MNDDRIADIDVLIPTFQRERALAVTLTSLAFQTYPAFDVVISDQSDLHDAARTGEVAAAIRVLELHGHRVRMYHHVPRKGMAEQRQFLLDQAAAPYGLFLDDDLILEPDIIGRLRTAIGEEGCGFVGCGLIGLSFLNDVRPQEQQVEFWEERVRAEEIVPGSREWRRYRLHNAANLYHLQRRLGLGPGRQKKYKVAWVGGCVLYDTDKLRRAGGFSFWRVLPTEHCGEDVLAQLQVLRRFGGCGILPSGVYHQELPTTLIDRTVVAPLVLGVE
jgi:GT2 family glycosyltransferase